MVRAGSVNYAMEDGYVPDYHTGRRMSAQSEHVCLASSGRMFGLGVESNRIERISN